jgi:hypothetical protein
MCFGDKSSKDEVVGAGPRVHSDPNKTTSAPNTAASQGLIDPDPRNRVIGNNAKFGRDQPYSGSNQVIVGAFS